MNNKQKEIKIELDKLFREIEELTNPLNDQVILKLAEKLAEKKREYLRNNVAKIDKLRDKETRLQMEFSNAKSKPHNEPLDIEKFPKKVKEWFNKRRGYSEGKQWSILWISDCGNYVIMKQPGGNYWSGRGNTSYAKTTHGLHNIEDAITKSIMEIEGRIKNSDLEEMKKMAGRQKLGVDNG